MAIISAKKTTEKEKIKVDVDVDILTKIKEYCAWAKVDDIGFFIEEAASFVFSKDKDWKEHQRKIKRGNKD